MIFLGAGVSLSVGLARNARGMIHGFLAREAREFRWTVFLTDYADRPSIEDRLAALPGARFVRFITKEEALERASKDPALAEGLKLTSRNPLPESFEVEWGALFIRPEHLDPMAQRVEALDGVDEVGFDRSRVERMALLARLGTQWDLAVSVLVWVGTAAALFWAARLLFWTAAPIPWREAGAGLLAGAAGGAAAMGVVYGWLGTPDPWTPLAGAGVALLAVLSRTV